MKRIISWVAGVLLLIIVAGIIFEQVSQSKLNKNKPAVGNFTLINNRNIHFVKKGEGGPTIVFQSGLGGDHKIWKTIQDSLSAYATTISYDRTGLMWSDDSDEPKTLNNITEELINLLEQTKCPKPYILVGHSLAGITLRKFIAEKKDDIEGIIFIDCAHPLLLVNSSEELKKSIVAPPEWVVKLAVNTGLFRTIYSYQPFVKDLPADHWFNVHVKDYFYTSYRMVLQEAQEDDLMFEEAANINSFDSIPLTVITAAYPNGIDFVENTDLKNEYRKLHYELQNDLLNLSAINTHIIAKKSGHYVPLQEPELVIETIKELLAKRTR